jgi:hypothetical protein
VLPVNPCLLSLLSIYLSIISSECLVVVSTVQGLPHLRCQKVFFLFVFVQDLMQQIPDGLEDLFAARIGQIQVVVHVMVADCLVGLYKSLIDVDSETRK